jgi:hypothetical protein
MFLTSENVNKTFIECLFKDDETTENVVKAEGITMNVGFHPERLKKNEEKIQRMLLELPSEFMKSRGGGWSFLNATNNKDGHQWANFHKTMEELLLLGLATKKVEYLMAREYWKLFPGGLPYFAVNDEDN